MSNTAQADSSRTPGLWRLVTGLIVAQIFSMAGSTTFASTLVALAGLWHLDSTRAGWISSAYLAGYTIGVPLLVTMTDSFDPRFIYLIGCGLGALANAGFAWLAGGLWSAFCLQALAGLALSGTYMPGLRLLTARLRLRTRVRAVPYYTAAFGTGTSLSFLICGWMAARYGWPVAFIAGAAGSLCAALLALVSTWGVPLQPDLNIVAERHPLDVRPVLSNVRAVAYTFAYGGHCWELFGFRAWLPTFLLFAWSQSHSSSAGLGLSRWSMLIVLIGVPVSILAAEVAERGGRDRLIRWFECASIVGAALSAISVNFSFELTLLALFVYNSAITADSGALTAGTVAVAKPGEQGATLAIYSLIGFGGGAIGPLVVGSALDLAGGFNRLHAWYLGFGAMAAGSALAAIVLLLFGATRQPSSPNIGLEIIGR